MQKTPFMLIVGEEEEKMTIRRHGQEGKGISPLQ
jgi:hypothetical protein